MTVTDNRQTTDHATEKWVAIGEITCTRTIYLERRNVAKSLCQSCMAFEHYVEDKTCYTNTCSVQTYGNPDNCLTYIIANISKNSWGGLLTARTLCVVIFQNC